MASEPVVFPFKPDGGSALIEQYGYETEVLSGDDATEQRIQRRRHPVGGVEFSLVFSQDELQDAQRAMALIEGNLEKAWAVPLWQYACPPILGIAVGASSVLVLTVDAPFLNVLGLGRYVLLWQSPTHYELHQINTVTSVTIGIFGTVSTAYPLNTGTLVLPVRRGRLVDAAEIPRLTGTAWGARLRFRFDAAQDEYSEATFALFGGMPIPVTQEGP